MASTKGFTPFSQIIGQERAIRFLKQAVAREKIPHAYLFAGIPGVGKTSTAVALMQAVNCREPVGQEGCGCCMPCRQIMNGTFPDFELLGPEGQSIKIEQIRNLDRSLGFMPLSGRYRVSVVRQAETMTDEAANAFLKTLEEPPLGNILVLTVIDPLDLLPTIVSRCQKVPFLPIPARLIEEWLMAEKGLEKAKASLLAKISVGSLGRAMEMCESDYLEKRREYLLRVIDLPRLSTEEALEMALEQTGRQKKKEAERPDRGETGVPGLLATWKTWFRDLIVVKTTGHDGTVINMDFSSELKNMSKDFTIDYLIDSLFVLDQAERDYLRFRNVDLMMENTVLRLRKTELKKNLMPVRRQFENE
ncbi:MAG: DNA polymerase III subunit delta' [Pseudomonadota bacterium]